MPDANINDPASIERLYPREDFERDGGENGRAKATVHRGIRILSPVAPDGRFSAERGTRHVGEADPEGDTVFLAPFLTEANAPLQQGAAYGGPVEAGDASDIAAQKSDDYRAFLDRVAEAAKAAEFKSPIGRHEERLRGFHGG
jgi:hypothetical protein